MKLIFAIVNKDDSKKLIEQLNKNKFAVTKISSTGGFLRSGNTTLIIGVDDTKVDTVIKIIKKYSRSRKITSSPTLVPVDTIIPTETDFNYSSEIKDELVEMPNQYENEIQIGGATIFVTDVYKCL